MRTKNVHVKNTHLIKRTKRLQKSESHSHPVATFFPKEKRGEGWWVVLRTNWGGVEILDFDTYFFGWKTRGMI